MSKFNAKRKVPKSRKHLVETNENHKAPTRSMVIQLDINKIISRGNKYIKKLKSNIRKII